MKFEQMPPGLSPPESITCVVEVPKGGTNKFEYDEDYEVFRLDRVLHSPLFYPCDYGFIPQTRADDGDHLDALIVVTLPSFTGAVIECRPVGMLRMKDDKGPDMKLLCVPINDPRFRSIYRLEHLAPHILKEISHFFEIYKNLEKKMVHVDGWENDDAAKQEILRCIEVYKHLG
jgi:inorganic pyrophosphatase